VMMTTTTMKKIHLVTVELFHAEGKTEGDNDMTKLIVALRNLGKRLKFRNLDTITNLVFTLPSSFVFSLLMLLIRFRAHMAFG
jgi:hypothetical protein